MIATVLLVALQVSIPNTSELRVERISFPDAETHEYRVPGGLGIRCALSSINRVDCGPEEFYAEFRASLLHRALSITSSSICVTKQQQVNWLMYEAWLGTVMQTYLFPNRSIRFVDKGTAKDIPEYHRETMNAPTE